MGGGGSIKKSFCVHGARNGLFMQCIWKGRASGWGWREREKERERVRANMWPFFSHSSAITTLFSRDINGNSTFSFHIICVNLNTDVFLSFDVSKVFYTTRAGSGPKFGK